MSGGIVFYTERLQRWCSVINVSTRKSSTAAQAYLGQSKGVVTCLIKVVGSPKNNFRRCKHHW